MLTTQHRLQVLALRLGVKVHQPHLHAEEVDAIPLAPVAAVQRPDLNTSDRRGERLQRRPARFRFRDSAAEDEHIHIALVRDRKFSAPALADRLNPLDGRNQRYQFFKRLLSFHEFTSLTSVL